MSGVFIKILNMGVTASWLILAVIAARLLLKKAPKWISCLLWALVAVRLVCPFSLQSVFSLVPETEPIAPPAVTQTQEFRLISDDTPVPSAAQTVPPQPQPGADGTQTLVTVLACLWLAGIAAMLLYALISFLKLKKSVSHGVRADDGTLTCKGLKTPFILGVFRPVICLPAELSEDTRTQVLRHERAHLKRRDHLFKPLGFLLLSVYWFHPLCWAAYLLLCRDIESACDEKVLRGIGGDRVGIAAYSQALLDCSFQRKQISACPLAFGEVGVKQRIKGILNYKKPAFWIILVSLVLCIAIAVCLMTDPFSEKQLTGKLAVSMDTAVSEHCRPECREGLYYAQDINVLKIKRSGDTATVYATVCWGGYSYNGVDVTEECGAYVSTAVTFDISDADGAAVYPVLEYWEPRDGGYYAKDIRAKFPFSVRKQVFDRTDADRQIENCNKAALEYYAAGTNADTSTQPSTVFTARVMQISGGALLVQPTQGTSFPDGSCPVSLPASSLPSSQTPAVGDLLRIEFDGTVMETYPLQLGKIYSVSIENQNSPAFTAVTKVAFAGWTPDERLTSEALNADQFAVNAATRLPVYKFDTKTQLDRFRDEFGQTLNMDSGCDGIPSFNKVTAAYDDAFFAEHAVVMAYVSASSGTFRYAIQRVFISGQTLCVEAVQTNDPETYTCDMSGWFVFAEVAAADISDCTAFDAWLTDSSSFPFTVAGISFPIPEGFLTASRAELRYFFGEDVDNVYGYRKVDVSGHTVRSILIRVFDRDAQAQFDSFTAENVLAQYKADFPGQSPVSEGFEETTVRGLTAKIADISMNDSECRVFCFLNNGQCVIAEYNVNNNANDTDVTAPRDFLLGIGIGPA